MSRRPVFRPTALSLLTLEDRIALSHATAAADVASVAAAGIVQGTIVTKLPARGLLGAGYSSELVGSAAHSTFGPIHVTIHLSANGSLPPQYSGARGMMTVRSDARGEPGEMTAALGGPFSTLQSGTLLLTFTTETATGRFRKAEGSTGTYQLGITTEREPHDEIAKGTFIMFATS